MGAKTIVIFAAAALVLLGLCSVVMSRMGKEVGETGMGDAIAAKPKELLKPTATFNVSQRTEDGVNFLPQTLAIADQLNDPETTAEDDLTAIDELLRVHLTAFNTIPQGGENVEIMQKLTGQNERGLAMITPGHKSLNEKGELIDRWGTPYHFHPVSKDVMEVRSAGPDLQLFTEDDVFLSDAE